LFIIRRLHVKTTRELTIGENKLHKVQLENSGDQIMIQCSETLFDEKYEEATRVDKVIATWQQQRYQLNFLVDSQLL
jgi:hypothetical protein